MDLVEVALRSAKFAVWVLRVAAAGSAEQCRDLTQWCCCAKLSDVHHPPCRGGVTRVLCASRGDPRLEHSCRVECVECVQSAGCVECARCVEFVESVEFLESLDSLGFLAWRSARSGDSAGRCQFVALFDIGVLTSPSSNEERLRLRRPMSLGFDATMCLSRAKAGWR